MTDNAQSLAASPNFEKLKVKLRELFELDKADLDFGIYRILRQRHDQIAEFLDKHLEQTVREALQSHGSLQQAQIEGELRKAEAAAREAGFDPELSPKIKELRAKLGAGANLDATADEVYSHLLKFFSRYYQEGDFLGLHRTSVQGREKYMIPYNGEEVKLVWANMDQYYIKSSELLRDYTFHVRQSDLTAGQFDFGDKSEEVVVHFKLVEGDTEKDNRKPSGKTTRAFALDAERPFEEVDETTLNIRFRYREQSAERDLQKKLNEDTERTLADNLPPRWRALLFADDLTYAGKDKKDTRTVLQKHLRGYTAKFQFDYFIHKDLGGFLRRELDFYIKNEVMYLDDIEAMAAPRADEYISKIRALRRCAMPIIQMLEQLENFQQKLWLKKKFVVETRYCLTLDQVPESLYEEVCATDAQWVEWEHLYSISEIEPDLFTPHSTRRTLDFLKANPYLVLDTRHFSREFTIRLLGYIEDLDEKLSGVCFNSENYQALQFMQEMYREQIKCIYIDPPYNTDAGPIAYKNGYRSSSWVSLMENRLITAKDFLTDEGIICVTIDDYQVHELASLLDSIFNRGNQLGVSVIRNNPSGRSTVKGLSVCHEYAFFYRRTEAASLERFPRSEKQLERFTQEEGIHVDWRNFRKDGGAVTHRSERPKQFYPIYVRPLEKTLRIPDLSWNKTQRQWDVLEPPAEDEITIWPIDEKGKDRVWSLNHVSAQENLADLEVRTSKEGDVQVFRRHIPSEGVLPRSWWDKNTYAAREYGSATLTNLFGESSTFSFAKSPYAVQDCVWIAGLNTESEDYVLDFFAGSGTTGHAVINLNREDGNRKYILTEMGEYFDTVLVPRLKKAIYSADWKHGRPQNRNTGVSHIFKVVCLESYEDTLNNLRLHRTPEQEAALRKASDSQRAEYLLGYFLDVESAGSASLLNVPQFRDPFGYQMHIATTSAGETKETPVDLVETFNWLIGLKVSHITAGEGFLSVTGEKRDGSRTLIIWRTLSEASSSDGEALEKYLVRLEVNPADTDFDFIYVNGSHTLHDPNNKIHLIEEEFQRRMFESESFESLG